MTRLPEISPQYHQYFIHEFFFPIINSFHGIGVSFVWTKDGKVLPKATKILEQFPIRKNESMIEHEGKFYKQAETKEEFKSALVSNLPHSNLLLISK